MILPVLITLAKCRIDDLVDNISSASYATMLIRLELLKLYPELEEKVGGLDNLPT